MIPFVQVNLQFPIINRQDSSHNAGGVLIYIRGDIAHKVRNEDLSDDKYIQLIVLELTIKREKWFVCTMYKSPSTPTTLFLGVFRSILESLLAGNENIMFLSDANFNMLHENALCYECESFNLSNIIKSATDGLHCTT
jgi:hypothetical protein